MDAYEYYVNKHLDKQERLEKALDRFSADIEPYLSDIEDSVKTILSMAKEYDEYYDFTDEALEMIKDIL